MNKQTGQQSLGHIANVASIFAGYRMSYAEAKSRGYTGASTAADSVPDESVTPESQNIGIPADLANLPPDKPAEQPTSEPQ